MFRVLVADGEPLAREGLRAAISRVDGFELVHAVSSGEKAVQICREDPVDLAFLSSVLSGLSGLEAARRIQEDHPGITVALVSPLNDLDLMREALQSGIKRCISKPVSFAAIHDILAELAAEHAALQLGEEQIFRDGITGRDFRRVYEAIGPAAETLRSRAGHGQQRRCELLRRIRRNLSDPLSEDEDLPCLSLDRLAADSGVDICLFAMLDEIFRRRCLLDYPFMRLAFTFIDSNIEEKIGLGEIVEHCAASQTHVSRIFKKYFSLSAMDYLHLRKLNLAKEYFAFTGDGIADVAFRLGYSEAGYFSKVFKKYEKMTVREYRASKRA